MKMFLLSLSLILSHSAFASSVKLVCSPKGSIDRLVSIEVIEIADGKVMVTSTDETDRPTSKVSTTAGRLDANLILVRQTDRTEFGTDRVYLERRGNAFNLVKINQCNFFYQEETCSAQEDQQFEEMDRENNVDCQLKF